MPIKELVSVALMILTGICVTHPMNAALAIRKVELSILREASDTRSWGVPVIFPEGKSTRSAARSGPHTNRRADQPRMNKFGHNRRLFFLLGRKSANPNASLLKDNDAPLIERF
jgi:hypothetical protein